MAQLKTAEQINLYHIDCLVLYSCLMQPYTVVYRKLKDMSILFLLSAV